LQEILSQPTIRNYDLIRVYKGSTEYGSALQIGSALVHMNLKSNVLILHIDDFKKSNETPALSSKQSFL